MTDDDGRSWAAQVDALGGFIRTQRQLAKLSLRQMAALSNVSNAYLSQVERGLHQPSLKVLNSIAEALQLSTEQLLARAGWAVSQPDAGAAPSGTEDAIQADPRLSAEQRVALISVYRSFVGPDRGRPGRGRSPSGVPTSGTQRDPARSE